MCAETVRRRAVVAAGMPVRVLVMARLPDAIELTMPDGTTHLIGLRCISSPVHQCPAQGSTVTSCCGRTPFQLPRTDRMTVDGEVTCRGSGG